MVSLRRMLSGGQAGSGRSFRGWAGRVSGRSDRRLLLALAAAMDAMATHCDLLADRLASQEVVTADLADVFGQEIAQLRAEVLHLRRSVAALTDTGS
jgi:cell division protein FtsB